MSDRCAVCGMPAAGEVDGIKLCRRCLGAYEEGSLRLLREDGQLVVMQRNENGDWTHRTIPLVESRPMPLYELGELTFFMRNVRRLLREASNDTLKEYFWELERLEGGTFIARCSIVRELYERAKIDDSIDERAALRYAAKTLEISYGYARKLHSVYENVVAPLESKQEDVPELPAGFFIEAAMRARKHGIDPVKAVLYAADRLAQEPSYRREDFVRDLKAGLPEIEARLPEEPPPSCLNCVHLKKAGGDTKLILMRGDSVIAEGPGKGVYYCELLQATKEEILEWNDFYSQAQRCIEEGRYERRTD